MTLTIVVPGAVAYPGLCSMKKLKVSVLPPERDASPLQGFPQSSERPITVHNNKFVMPLVKV